MGPLPAGFLSDVDDSPATAQTQQRQEAFARFVVPEIELLLRVARTLASREAEDLVQETLLRAYRSIGQFDGRHPRAWLLTILRNAAANHHRRRTPQPRSDRDLAEGPLWQRPSAQTSPEDEIMAATFEAAVETALGKLPTKSRQVIELVDVRGLSCREAAVVLAVPPGTVMSRLHRARERMRQCLPTPVAPRVAPPVEAEE